MLFSASFLMYKKDELYKLFQLPIQYHEHNKIYENLNTDLELIDTTREKEKESPCLPGEISNNVEKTKELNLTDVNDNSKNIIYKNICKPKSKPGNVILNTISQYYTTNVDFLKDTQKLCEDSYDFVIDSSGVNKICDIWNFIKNDKTFLSKNHFIEWNRFSWLNNSVLFLTFVSFFHLFSPVINLLSPFLILIIPFFILKLFNTPINFENYKRIFFQQLRRHSIGQLFFEFSSVSFSRKIYLLFMAWVYVYNIYNNIMSCKKFYKNVFTITNNFNTIISYNEVTLKNMEKLLMKIKHLKTYSEFYDKLNNNYKHLYNFNEDLKKLPINTGIRSKIFNIGNILKELYSLHTNNDIENIIQYSIGFNGYIDVMSSLSENIKTKKVSPCKFSKELTKFKDLYHPNIQIDQAVKNNVILDKNIIITGPNAAGKTTILKSIIINLLLSQQFGVGYYSKKTLIKPYDYIHCYINIPDTSHRDSLFQAEARRCKNILDIINTNKDKRHFCIFDELFSGTNPYEAIGCGTSYLKYLTNNDNVRFLLTTHFDKLCKLLNKNDKIINMRMKANIKDNKPHYFYKIEKGISKIRGGITVLRELQFGEDIVENAENVLNNL